MEEKLLKYFPDLTSWQVEKLLSLENIYAKWNSMINVISRKDMENFMIHHVLHSLSISRVFSFGKDKTILDVGTGGGFPGIPLAIMFPEARFSLLDSIGKKIKVVDAVAGESGLSNVTALNRRAEDEKDTYDFVISRAVTDFPTFVKITRKNVRSAGKGTNQSGIICLKGGDLTAELGDYSTQVSIRNISDFFGEPFFETKKIVYLPL
ncbi:MAG TPA: 16S rRNA (guanine(527)-N(7))-methyltransferase RsmG [Bacteroidales bacterium]|nr:16S rRNA (guanine(527)-N(7))-methyltransferase RsmG [Bacteroidales bacterium]